MIERLVRNEAPSLLDTEKANELIDAINGLLNSKGGNGISVKQGQNGELLIASEGQDKINKRYNPFEVISVDEENVVINPGLVNGFLVNSTEVSNMSGTSYLCLQISGDESGVNSVDLIMEGSPPDGIPFQENGIETTFKFLIAIVGETSLESQIVKTNLSFRVGIAAEIPKDEVALGEYPNHIYYTWEQSAV